MAKLTKGDKRMIIRKSKGVCKFCNKHLPLNHLQVHHIDGNRNNHNECNLIPICCTCHKKISDRQMRDGQAYKYKRMNATKHNNQHILKDECDYIIY